MPVARTHHDPSHIVLVSESEPRLFTGDLRVRLTSSLSRSFFFLVKQAPDLAASQAATFHPVSQATTDSSLFPPAADLLQTSQHQDFPLEPSWADPFQFSAMSGTQVIETVMNAGDFDPRYMSFRVVVDMDFVDQVDNDIVLLDTKTIKVLSNVHGEAVFALSSSSPPTSHCRRMVP